MAVIHLLWLMLVCCSVGDVYCQTFPYVSFMGHTLANHSYVNLSLVGDHRGGESVECVPNLSTCCSGVQGVQRGDWYFPDGIDCHSLEMVISMSNVDFSGFT